MKKEIVTGTGIQGINVSFSIQEMITMNDFLSNMKKCIRQDNPKKLNDLFQTALVLHQGIHFFEKLLKDSDIPGLYETHVDLFGESKLSNNEL